ncbi:MAG: cysteine peptidase family C39 domain-containing protein [Planctomycetota bacterium]
MEVSKIPLRFACVVLLVASLAHPVVAQRSVVRDARRSFGRQVVSWVELKNQNVVMQKQDYSCGAAAVATVLRYYWGEDVTEADVLSTLAISLKPHALQDRTANGLTMADLKVVSERMDYTAAVGQLDTIDELREAKVPLVVSLALGGQDHFVVYRGIRGNCVFIADPIRGNYRLSIPTFLRAWNEKAVFVVTPEGKTSSAVSRLGIRPEELTSLPVNRQVIRQAVGGVAVP